LVASSGCPGDYNRRAPHRSERLSV
jgi:hypothetical protein